MHAGRSACERTSRPPDESAEEPGLSERLRNGCARINARQPIRPKSSLVVGPPWVGSSNIQRASPKTDSASQRSQLTNVSAQHIMPRVADL
jgi:hypothetical protein